jgi:hypothetical protein
MLADKIRWSGKFFKKRHHDIDLSIRRLSCTSIRRKSVEQIVVEQLQESSMASLPAASPVVRTYFVDELVSIFAARLGRDPREFYQLTLVPEGPRTSLQSRGSINPAAVRLEVCKTLAGLNYIGAVDLAAYDISTQHRQHLRTISLHAHLIVWGGDAKLIRGLVSAFDRENYPLLPGFKPAFAEQLTDAGRTEWLRYTVKFPVKEYQAWAKPKKPGRWKQEKKPIRPGTAARLAALLAPFSLREILISGGEGAEILSSALKRTRMIIRDRQQDARRGNVTRVFGREVANRLDREITAICG